MCNKIINRGEKSRSRCPGPNGHYSSLGSCQQDANPSCADLQTVTAGSTHPQHHG